MACLQTDRYNLMGWKIDGAGQSRGRSRAKPLRVREIKCRARCKGWLQPGTHEMDPQK